MSLLRTTPLEKLVFGGVALGVLVWWLYMGWLFYDAFSSPGPPTMATLAPAALMFFAFVGLVFVGIFAVNHRQRKRQAARDAQAAAFLERLRTGASSPESFFVYLRPFAAHEHRTATETLVIQLFESYGPLITVDEPGHQLGIGRLALADDEWKPTVLALCAKAAAIIIYPAASDGTLWELGQLREHGWLDKTFVFMPPNIPLGPLKNRVGLQLFWEPARVRAHEVGLELPAYVHEGGLYRFRGSRAELVSAFERDHLFGRRPSRALEALEPVVRGLLNGPDCRTG